MDIQALISPYTISEVYPNQHEEKVSSEGIFINDRAMYLHLKDDSGEYWLNENERLTVKPENLKFVKNPFYMVSERRLLKCISTQFCESLARVLKYKTNIDRPLTNITAPIDPNFYYGRDERYKFKIIGLWKTANYVLKITFDTTVPSEPKISAISIPFHINEGSLTVLNRTYNNILRQLKSKGFARTFVDRDKYIVGQRPVSTKKAPTIFPVYASQKIDGIRCQALWSHDRWLFISRQGKFISHMNTLKYALEQLPSSVKSLILNFEIFHLTEPLSSLTGYLNSNTVPDNFFTNIVFYLFDASPVNSSPYPILNDELKITDTSTPTYRNRLNNVFKINNYCVNRSINLIRCPKFRICNTIEEFHAFYKECINEKFGEGIVWTSNAELVYSPGTSPHLFKTKKFTDFEVFLLDIVAGTGQASQRAYGVFLYDGKEHRAMITGTVEESKNILANKDKYINTLVTVKVVAADDNIRHATISIATLQPMK